MDNEDKMNQMDMYDAAGTYRDPWSGAWLAFAVIGDKYSVKFFEGPSSDEMERMVPNRLLSKLPRNYFRNTPNGFVEYGFIMANLLRVYVNGRTGMSKLRHASRQQEPGIDSRAEP